MNPEEIADHIEQGVARERQAKDFTRLAEMVVRKLKDEPLTAPQDRASDERA